VPSVLYVDLNYWIDLARGRLKRPGHEPQARAYDALRRAVAAGDVIVPLSTAHYMEMANIKDPWQRAELALTMDEISRYVTFTAPEILVAHELRRSLARVFDLTYVMAPPEPLGDGFAHAFGHRARARIRGPADVLERWAEQRAVDVIARIEQRAGYGWRYIPSVGAGTPLERVQEALDKATQFMMLRGLDDEDIPKLRDRGYDPSLARNVIDRIRMREAELAKILEAEPVPPARLAEYISARAWYWDLREHWDEALADVGLGGLTLEEIGKERIHKIVAGIPIVAVESAIRQRRFRNETYSWEPNDVYDISFIGQAVVYCDALLTDKDLSSHLVLQRIDREYNVKVLRNLEALGAWLEVVVT
jgi:hypothetical protein